MSAVTVIVPIYKPAPSARETFALDHSLGTLTAYPLVFIAPLGLNVSYYAQRYGGAFRFYAPDYFASVAGYSRLLLSVAFYEQYITSEYLLILQPDVFVLRDELEQWLKLPFDYLGAPWPQGFEFSLQIGKFAALGGKTVKIFVGNGGFSLRRRSKCAALLREYADIADWFIQTGSSEDLFFSILGSLSTDFILPNQMMASRFAVELEPRHYHLLNNGQLPMAVHAWEKYDPEFWRSHLPPWPD